MKTQHTLSAAIALCLLLSGAAIAQEPPSPQEQQLIQQMREAAKAQGMTITPEMEQQMLRRYREINANMMGMRMATQAQKGAQQAPPPQAAAPVTAPPAPRPSAPQATTAASPELGAQLRPHHDARRPAAFEEAADGFRANGRLWMDPMGEIQTYGIDPATGDVTYLVEAGGGRHQVRYANVNASAPPVDIGVMSISPERVTLETADGQTVGGTSFVAMADGILVIRGGSVFRYRPGQALASQTVPAGYAVLYAQGGDVGGTGYILAMKRGTPSWADVMTARPGGEVNTWRRSQTRGVFGASPSRVGLKQPTSFGSRPPDFALIDIESGRSVVVPRSELTTDLGWEDRHDNKQHFINAIRWFPTSIGPIAIVGGDDNASVYAIHLPTGRQEMLFKRVMGINSWGAEPTADGGIRVRAQLGLRRDEIADVREKFGGAQ